MNRRLLETPAQAEYRAYMMHSDVPEGCIAFPVTDDTGAPHLCMGEFAVVDPADRSARSGEVYLVQWGSGRRSICSIKAYANGCVDASPNRPIEWWIGGAAYPWHKPGGRQRSAKESFDLLRRYGSNDGPITDPEYLQSKLIGRVVGIFSAAVEGPMRDVTPAKDV